MTIKWFDRRGNEIDGQGNRIHRFNGEIVAREIKPKPKTAAAPASPPANPPKPNSNKEKGYLIKKTRD